MYVRIQVTDDTVYIQGLNSDYITGYYVAIVTNLFCQVVAWQHKIKFNQPELHYK